MKKAGRQVGVRVKSEEEGCFYRNGKKYQHKACAKRKGSNLSSAGPQRHGLMMSPERHHRPTVIGLGTMALTNASAPALIP